MPLTSSLDSLLWFSALLLAYYLGHRYWKYKALERARAWAADQDLTIIASRPTTLSMHRQRPRITFWAEDQAGHTYACRLQLRATSLFSGPLSMSASVEVLERAEVSSNAA